MINYADKEEWAKFIRENIIPLRDSAEFLVNYWEYLRRRMDGVYIDAMDEDYKSLVLGGVSEEGAYLEGSVAKFYRDFFGVSLNVELPQYVSAVKEGLTKGIMAVVSESLFVRFASEVATQTRKIEHIALSKEIIGIVEHPKEDVRGEEFDALVRKPDEVIKLIEEFYNKCARITPNYNEHSLFILTIRTITRRYLEEAYPEFKEKFEELRSFFGLKPLFTPKIEESEMKQKYTIWHLPEGSFGGEIKKLYEIVWDYNSKLKELLSQYFEEIVDLKEEFFEMAKNSVALSSETLNVGKLLSEIFHLDAVNPLQVELWHYYYDYSRGYRRREIGNILNVERPVPLTEVLDEISPFLFAGLINISKVEEGEIIFEPLKW